MRLATIFTLITLAFLCRVNLSAESKGKTEKLDGRVIAYGKYDTLGAFGYDGMAFQTLIVRTEAKHRPPRYVKIIYTFFVDEVTLPAEIYTASARWQFKVVRDAGCDVRL